MGKRLALIAVAVAALAQEFEVASVKQNMLNDRIVEIHVGPGPRFTTRGYTLVLLMQRAYTVMDWNVTGGPPWIRDDRWDIVAKANVQGNLTEEQLRPALAKLLADRFQLQFHTTTKEMSGYALEVARGGSKLARSADSRERPDSFRFLANGITGQRIPMRTFARWLGGKVNTIVVDQTGLQGLYDFNVTWHTDPDAPDPREALREAAFTAVQAQLGLRLIAKKVPVEVLVIDRVERPSAQEN